MSRFEIQAKNTTRIHGLRGTAGMYLLAERGGKALILAETTRHARELLEAYTTFRPGARAYLCPPLEGSPYAFTPVHASVRRARVLCFDALQRNDWDVIATTPKMLLEPLPPEANLLRPQLFFESGESYDLHDAARDLAQMGYQNVDMVGQPGDFAIRGGILDVFTFNSETAYRLDFFDEELEEIRTFDPSTQRATGSAEHVRILPLFEWILGEEQAQVFGHKGGQHWNGTAARGAFLELVAQIRDRGRFGGSLHWTALFFHQVRHITDWLPADSHVYVDDWGLIRDSMDGFLEQLDAQIDALQNQLTVPAAALFHRDPPGRVVLPGSVRLLSHRTLKMGAADADFITHSIPGYQNNPHRFFTHWQARAKTAAIVLVCDSPGMMQRFDELFSDEGFLPKTMPFPLPDDLAPGFYLAKGHLATGFEWPERGLCVISERDIWTKKQQRRRRPAGKKVFDTEFRDLKIGDLVVHMDHGIGKFLGLVEMDVGGATHEMMALEYYGGQKLYVHLNQLDVIQRHGSDLGNQSLDKLGGTSWAKTKAKVKKAIRDMADELVKLYAARRLVAGHRYKIDTEWQREFEDAFEHEPTEGQLAAVADIKRDLESERPMDRLLVGDVGFGKTEVSMRFAFKAVMEGFQVAVLCPTTVLAFQHFHTFKNRFAAFPVNIRWISRFSSPKQIKESLAAAADGSVDILIGTHRLISKDVQFHRLGALVVDEEQRFGVGHKERLKHLRKQVDVLSMSATPIPRTLNMSLTGIRDISVIETPPSNRLSINTTVAEARDGLIKNAIEFERQREGQVFFIHNRVETMESVATNLRRLVPDATIDVAHGQMDPQRIERVMLKFMRQEIDILVASTIIENGVDIPNANTMIVNRADMFGMSQLYQLRGRIGRSDRAAYAYLLVPPRSRMTPEARKRLATLEEFSDLGSGFRIAAMDMELRGAGNLLGGQQAGHINTIGYDMYIKLLNEAVSELQGKPIEDEVNCLVNLSLDSGLPKFYIGETNQRLHYYKRFASAKTREDLDDIRETLADCYGELPDAVERLAAEHALRIDLSERRVQAVEQEKRRLKYKFHTSAPVDTALILQWVQAGRDVSVTPGGSLMMPLEASDPDQILAEIRTTIDQLLPVTKSTAKD